MRPRAPAWIRGTAIGTLVCFVYTNIVYGALAPAKSLWQERHAAVEKAQPPLLAQLPSVDTRLLSGSLASLDAPSQTLNRQYAGLSAQVPSVLKSLPLSYASLKELYLPKGYKPGDLLVLHIQDAHGNLEAQKNIARVIEAFSGQSRVLVGLEGARGAFNFAPYRTFPDREITKKVAGYLLQESLITGPEYAGMTVEHLPAYWGLEEEKPYLDHVKAYLDSSNHEKEAQEIKQKLEQALSQVKKASFGPKLAALDAWMTSYHQGKTGLGGYLSYLGTGSGKNTRLFLEALKLEKSLDYAEVEEQRKALTQALVAKLPKQDLDKLLQASLSYRAGNLTHGTFYRYLQDLCGNHGIALAKYPEMGKYVRYVLASESIRSEGLFRELQSLEQTRIHKLARTEAEKKAIALSQDLLLAEKVMSYGVSSAEWEAYKARQEEIQSLPGRLGQNAPLKALLDSYGKFSQCAVARNSILIHNLLNKAKEEKNTQLAILVTGGFHTSGMMAELKARHIAYAVVTPRLGKVEGTGTEYLQVFRRDKTPLEKLFSGDRITLAHHLSTAIAQLGIDDGTKERFVALAVKLIQQEGRLESVQKWLEHPETGNPEFPGKIETVAVLQDGDRILRFEIREEGRPEPIACAVQLRDPSNPAQPAFEINIDGRRLLFSPLRNAGSIQYRVTDIVRKSFLWRSLTGLARILWLGPEALHGTEKHEHPHSSSKVVIVALTVGTLVFSLVEFVSALGFHSLILRADSFHMLMDALGYVAILLAMLIRPNARHLHHEGEEHHHEHHASRSEIAARFLNGLLLLAGALWTFRDTLTPGPVNGLGVLIVSILGLAVNGGSALLLGKMSQEGHVRDPNHDTLFAHNVGDALGSAAAVLSSLIILALGLFTANPAIYIVDPILGAFVTFWVLRLSWNLLKTSWGELQEYRREHGSTGFLAWLGEPKFGTPTWETVTFHLPGMSAFLLAGGSVLGVVGLAWALFGFGFAHVIRDWVARAKRLEGDRSPQQPWLHFAPAALFFLTYWAAFQIAFHLTAASLPGFDKIIAVLAGAVATALVHSIYNRLVLWARNDVSRPGKSASLKTRIAQLPLAGLLPVPTTTSPGRLALVDRWFFDPGNSYTRAFARGDVSILDIGIGNPYPSTTYEFAQKLSSWNPRARLIGIDPILPEPHNLRPDLVNLNVMQGDVFKLDPARLGGSIQIVRSFNLFRHFTRQESNEAIRAIGDLLAEGGLFFEGSCPRDTPNATFNVYQKINGVLQLQALVLTIHTSLDGRFRYVYSPDFPYAQDNSSLRRMKDLTWDPVAGSDFSEYYANFKRKFPGAQIGPAETIVFRYADPEHLLLDGPKAINGNSAGTASLFEPLYEQYRAGRLKPGALRHALGWLGEPKTRAPLWETGAFHLPGMSAFLLAGGSVLGIVGLAWALFGFGFAHVIRDWVLKAKGLDEDGVARRPWLHFLPASLFFLTYWAAFQIAFHLTAVFLPGFDKMIAVLAGAVATALVHSVYNRLVLWARRERRPSLLQALLSPLPLASLGPSHSDSREDESVDRKAINDLLALARRMQKLDSEDATEFVKAAHRLLQETYGERRTAGIAALARHFSYLSNLTQSDLDVVDYARAQFEWGAVFGFLEAISLLSQIGIGPSSQVVSVGPGRANNPTSIPFPYACLRLGADLTVYEPVPQWRGSWAKGINDLDTSSIHTPTPPGDRFENCQLPPGSVDLVDIFSVLSVPFMPAEAKTALLKKASEILRPGGCLVIGRYPGEGEERQTKDALDRFMRETGYVLKPIQEGRSAQHLWVSYQLIDSHPPISSMALAGRRGAKDLKVGPDAVRVSSLDDPALLETVLAGIPGDTIADLKAEADAQRLQIALVSDPEGAFIKRAGNLLILNRAAQGLTPGVRETALIHDVVGHDWDFVAAFMGRADRPEDVPAGIYEAWAMFMGEFRNVLSINERAEKAVYAFKALALLNPPDEMEWSSRNGSEPLGEAVARDRQAQPDPQALQQLLIQMHDAYPVYRLLRPLRLRPEPRAVSVGPGGYALQASPVEITLLNAYRADLTVYEPGLGRGQWDRNAATLHGGRLTVPGDPNLTGTDNVEAQFQHARIPPRSLDFLVLLGVLSAPTIYDKDPYPSQALQGLIGQISRTLREGGILLLGWASASSSEKGMTEQALLGINRDLEAEGLRLIPAGETQNSRHTLLAYRLERVARDNLTLPSSYAIGRRLYPLYAWLGGKMGEKDWSERVIAPRWEALAVLWGITSDRAMDRFVRRHDGSYDVRREGMRGIRNAVLKGLPGALFRLYPLFALGLGVLAAFAGLDRALWALPAALLGPILIGSLYLSGQAHRRFNLLNPKAPLTLPPSGTNPADAGSLSNLLLTDPTLSRLTVGGGKLVVTDRYRGKFIVRLSDLSRIIERSPNKTRLNAELQSDLQTLTLGSSKARPNPSALRELLQYLKGANEEEFSEVLLAIGPSGRVLGTLKFWAHPKDSEEIRFERENDGANHVEQIIRLGVQDPAQSFSTSRALRLKLACAWVDQMVVHEDFRDQALSSLLYDVLTYEILMPLKIHFVGTHAENQISHRGREVYYRNRGIAHEFFPPDHSYYTPSVADLRHINPSAPYLPPADSPSLGGTSALSVILPLGMVKVFCAAILWPLAAILIAAFLGKAVANEVRLRKAAEKVADALLEANRSDEEPWARVDAGNAGFRADILPAISPGEYVGEIDRSVRNQYGPYLRYQARIEFVGNPLLKILGLGGFWANRLRILALRGYAERVNFIRQLGDWSAFDATDLDNPRVREAMGIILAHHGSRHVLLFGRTPGWEDRFLNAFQDKLNQAGENVRWSEVQTDTPGLLAGIYGKMLEKFNVPSLDKFILISNHPELFQSDGNTAELLKKVDILPLAAILKPLESVMDDLREAVVIDRQA